MSEREFDVIVVGAGSTGEVCAGRIAQKSDLRVAIVEDHLVGGECSYYACMPSKALLRPAEALMEVRRVPGAAEAVTGELDVDSALARRDQVISNLDDGGQVPWLESRNIELFRGDGALDGERRVRVGDDTLMAKKAVVVAVGTGAAIPPIDGIDQIETWDNREATTSKSVPESLVVLGGGAVGAEMAQAWATFGSRVSLVEAEERLLPTEEPFAGEELADGLRELGVDIHVGAKAVRTEQDDDGVCLELDDGTALAGSELLVAVGRRARTDRIGLETIGLEPGGFLGVDDQMRVDGSDWLYAAGDVNGRSLLTHMGKYQARIAADHILGEDVAATEDVRNSPRVVFTEPQVAAVGLTLEAAEREGLNVRAVDVPTMATAGASFQGRNAPGTTRIVVDEDHRVIVGMTFVGPDVADFLQAGTIAVVGEVPVERLWHAVPSFPTRSEVWLKLLEAYGL